MPTERVNEHFTVAAGLEGDTAVMAQAETDVGIGQGVAAGKFVDEPLFRGGAFEKFETGGHVIEEVFHGDDSALRRSHTVPAGEFTACHLKTNTSGFAISAGNNRHLADGGNGGKCFAAS